MTSWMAITSEVVDVIIEGSGRADVGDCTPLQRGCLDQSMPTQPFSAADCEWLRFRATESGIQVVGIFRDDCDDAAIARAAGAQGINVSPLSIQYRHGGPRRGLLMGFAAVDANTTEKAMSRLRAVLQEAFGQARRTERRPSTG